MFSKLDSDFGVAGGDKGMSSAIHAFVNFIHLIRNVSQLPGGRFQPFEAKESLFGAGFILNLLASDSCHR